MLLKEPRKELQKKLMLNYDSQFLPDGTVSRIVPLIKTVARV